MDQPKLPYVVFSRVDSPSFSVRFSIPGQGQKRVCLKTSNEEEAVSAYPVEFDASSFEADFEFEVDTTELTTRCDKAASKFRDTESLVKLVADGTKASIVAGKHVLKITLTGRATAGMVHLRSVDFGALAKAVDGLSLTGNAKVSFEIDPEVGMRVGFGTSLATYELYAPVLQPGSFKPYTQGFRPMAVA